ncbi:zinc ribbon domain-containing protein, partial [Coleofasciculus sp.]|uniref:zinc ribbon domain-containing protein n=1 Tax=Coleofasciculus sp. TaxID=3100458 RepID=UPI003A35C475
HNLCDWAGMIFAESLNLNTSTSLSVDPERSRRVKALAKGMLGKHCLDAGWGQFLQILEQCCFKRGVYFQKVDAKKTNYFCPECLTETGKKLLSERVHSCHQCGYTTDRDVAAAQIVRIRGLAAVGHTVKMLSEGKFTGIPTT